MECAKGNDTNGAAWQRNAGKEGGEGIVVMTIPALPLRALLVLCTVAQVTAFVTCLVII